jgi:hypothetical protein
VAIIGKSSAEGISAIGNEDVIAPERERFLLLIHARFAAQLQVYRVVIGGRAVDVALAADVFIAAGFSYRETEWP